MCQIAVLLTCYNRKEKTISCLSALYECNLPQQYSFDVYLVDDGSTDQTTQAVKERFSSVKIIEGNGKLFWAGGMREAWEAAINAPQNYKYYLLLNDDTLLKPNAFIDLFNDLLAIKEKLFILVGATVDPSNNSISYGGNVLKDRYSARFKMVIPNNKTPQVCHLGNANIMFVPAQVQQKIGILSSVFAHGIADFDYTLNARRSDIPTYVSSSPLGICQDDHGNNWTSKKTLKERINYLYSIKGLSYKEYLFFIKKHFPYYLPEAWFMLWMKTLFPFLWENFKKRKV